MAVKQLRPTRSSSAADFAREILINIYLRDHPNIPECIGACLDEQHLTLVMEKMEGSLEQKLCTERLYTECYDQPEVIKMLMEACSAVHYMHAKRVVHRDIAARNFLIGKGLKVYICDFGMSLYLPEGKGYGHVSPFGPVAWMAPEAIKTGEFSFKTDIYMFGIMLVEIFRRGKPYGEATTAGLELARKVCDEGLRPTHDPKWPDTLKDLINACLQEDPTERPKDMKEVKLKIKINLFSY